MSDYPDYFELVQIVGADIMVPIDVQGAYIMMPVDIQAQFLTLEIDLVAQSIGNIEVDLVAQTVGNLAVNITAQDLAQLNIEIDAQTVGIYLQPEWAALEGVDKNFHVFEANQARNGTAIILYEVPVGKTLYICGASFALRAVDAADGDKPQHGNMDITYQAPVIYVCALGGDGGGSVVLSKPVAIVAGKELRAILTNFSNHECSIGMAVWGYEL